MNWNQRSWLLAALASGLMCGGCGPANERDPETRQRDEPIPTVKSTAPEQPARRPNVVLISLDTVRPDHLGCYGYSKPTSPNIDGLAAQGVVFTNCRAQATWTLPSHMSMFTSMTPTDNGVDNLNKILSPTIPTLAELLQDEDYKTAALVNNGQMRAHWGFNRGFDTWREFEVDQPDGNCEHITQQAVNWLSENASADPFFLFLHYFDVHDPYAAPEEYRRKMGTTLSGPEARELAFRFRSPDRDIDDPDMLRDLQAAYDAEINWLDRELGRLFAAIPADTLIVIVSDHGEAFEEHGWMLHGASLYEEETRTVLLMRLPADRAASVSRREVEDSTMLMDVAPTILQQCGIRSPVGFQGVDLSGTWQGKPLRQRLVPAESKAVLEGRLSYSVVLHPLKAVYSVFDGRFELYKLPDEQTPLTKVDQVAVDAIFTPLRAWIATQQYWMLHAAGDGNFATSITLSEGRFGLFIPVSLEPGRDSFEVARDGRTIRWNVQPGNSDSVKSLFLQPADSAADLTIDFRRNGQREASQVFLGKNREHPAELPTVLTVDLPAVSPVIERRFTAEQSGLHIFHHRTAGVKPVRSLAAPLDERAIRQLRSLGYLQ